MAGVHAVLAARGRAGRRKASFLSDYYFYVMIAQKVIIARGNTQRRTKIS
jgi:hypothetical protein